MNFIKTLPLLCLVIKLGSSEDCESIATNTAVMIDYSRYQLQVTYDASKQGPSNKNPQVQFKVLNDANSSKTLGIRLPTDEVKEIKWSWETESLTEPDKDMQGKTTWTFEIGDDGLATLTSPDGNQYHRDLKQYTPDIKGGCLEVKFHDFMSDGVSCYQIIDPTSFIPTIIISETQITAVQDQSITLTCTTTVKQETTSISWHRATDVGPQDLTHHATVKNVTNTEDQTVTVTSTLTVNAVEDATYTCSLSDDVEISAVASLSVFR